MKKRLIDLDIVWGGEWGRLRDGVLDGAEIAQEEGAILGVNVGCPIVTKGDSVA